MDVMRITALVRVFSWGFRQQHGAMGLDIKGMIWVTSPLVSSKMARWELPELFGANRVIARGYLCRKLCMYILYYSM